MSTSQIIVNARMASYGDMAVAGIGVAMKVTMISSMICMGIGQGVQPLLGFCVGAGRWERFKGVMRFSLGFAFVLSGVMTALCYLLSGQIVGIFLTEAEAFDYAVEFTHIMQTTSILFGIFFVQVNALQAMGAATGAYTFQRCFYWKDFYRRRVWCGRSRLRTFSLRHWSARYTCG